VGALLGGARTDHLVVAGVLGQDPHQFRDPLVRVGHVRVGPHHDLAGGLLGAEAPCGAGAAVPPERGDLERGILVGDPLDALERGIGRRVVDHEQLVAEPARVHRRADPLDLEHDVILLVVAGQDDRDVRGRLGRG
jgi:hypothetical protein